MPENDTLANYSFLPWVRSGLGNEIIELDTLGASLPANPALNRPQVSVEANLKASNSAEAVNVNIPKTTQIQGPGDVLGINAKSIIRVHPKVGVTNFETNNLCYLEFYEEDLPWRFTPAKPSSGGKLRPWFALIVLKDNEYERNTQGGTPTPYITINPDSLNEVFYHEQDHYAMAHVHVLEDLGQNNGSEELQLKAKLNQNPDLALSRILCPRKLSHDDGQSGNSGENLNRYTAFLIPAFEVGRLAGLGENTDAVPAQKSSWSRADIGNNSNPQSYPYYYSWSFKVGPNGDFETLAELLTPRELPAHVGRRAMDLKNMGYSLQPTGSNATAYAEGAMKHADYTTAAWPINDNDLRNQLKNLLNLSADLENPALAEPQFGDSQGEESFFSRGNFGDDPIIAPPTYGKWHRGTIKLAHFSDWVHDLNLSPSHRAAAGLGTRVVQENQEEFMEMAWEQIGEINEANQKIIENELAKRAARSLLEKKLKRFDEVDLMAASGKAFERLRGNNGTLKKELKNSRIPTGMRSGTFARIAKGFTPGVLALGNSQGGVNAVLQPSLLFRINTDDDDDNRISAAPKRENPEGVLSASFALSAIEAVVDNPALTFMETVAEAIKAGGGKNLNVINAMNQLPDHFSAAERQRAENIFTAINKPLNEINEVEANLEATLSPTDFEDYVNTSFDQGFYRDVKFKKAVASAEPLIFSQNSLQAQRLDFKTQFSELFVNTSLNRLELAPRILAPVFDLQNLKITVSERLNPMINFQHVLQSFFPQPLQNQNKPLMAYPRFPLPMYSYLRNISPDYIIPNISAIEPNTITLMEPNKKFIEAFLVGMNHEFSRELLWREFPTDMRGSYFRHFWEYNNAPGTDQLAGETVKNYTQRLISYQNLAADVNELHNWGNNSLGDNHTGGPSLVLLVKGDLFKKYPNTLVYAHRAEFKGGNKMAHRELSSYEPQNVKWPILQGQLEPDVYFFGFELTEEDANGNRTDEPGWFFVLRERPGQVSFGLDDFDDDNTLTQHPENWDKVTWQHITKNAQTSPPYLKIKDNNITLSNSGTGPRNALWNNGSADMAYILYQSPILFARHASTMLND
jgi:hypothetical protein